MKKICILLCMASFATSAYCMKEPPKPVVVTLTNHLLTLPAVLKRYIAHHIADKDVDILHCANTDIDAKRLDEVCKGAKTIKTMILNGCNNLKDEGLLTASKIATAKKTTSLHIADIQIVEDAPRASQAKGLLSNKTITEFILSKADQWHLKHMHKGVISLDLGNCNKNVVIQLNNLANLKRLKSKRFYGLENTPIMQYIAKPQFFTHLDFSDCLDKPDFTKLKSPNTLDKFYHLTHLNLENTLVDDKAIKPLLSLSSLTSLNLHDTEISVKFFKDLGSSYKTLANNITELAYSPKQITRNDANIIFETFSKFKNLKKAKIPGLYHGKINFTYLPKKLEEIYFSKVDDSIAGYNWDHLKGRLSDTDIGLPLGVHTLTFEAYGKWKGPWSSMKNMVRLFTGTSEPIQKDGLKTLRTLTVKGFESFSDESIKHLLKSVTKLHIKDCGPIKLDKIEHLQNIQYGDYSLKSETIPARNDSEQPLALFLMKNIKTNKEAFIRLWGYAKVDNKPSFNPNLAKNEILRYIHLWTDPSKEGDTERKLSKENFKDRLNQFFMDNQDKINFSGYAILTK